MLLCTRNDRPDLLTLHRETVQALLPIPISHTAWLVLKGHDGFKLCPALGSGSGGVLKPLLAKQSRERWEEYMECR